MTPVGWQPWGEGGDSNGITYLKKITDKCTLCCWDVIDNSCEE